MNKKTYMQYYSKIGMWRVKVGNKKPKYFEATKEGIIRALQYIKENGGDSSKFKHLDK